MHLKCTRTNTFLCVQQNANMHEKYICIDNLRTFLSLRALKRNTFPAVKPGTPETGPDLGTRRVFIHHQYWSKAKLPGLVSGIRARKADWFCAFEGNKSLDAVASLSICHLLPQGQHTLSCVNGLAKCVMKMSRAAKTIMQIHLTTIKTRLGANESDVQNAERWQRHTYTLKQQSSDVIQHKTECSIIITVFH